MITIGKTAQHAIAVMEFLVECSEKRKPLGGTVSSEVVAKALGLSNALAGKILSNLSRARIIRGASGPGGGYELHLSPKDIKLLDVVSCFESRECKPSLAPNHFSEKFNTLEDMIRRFLAENDFETSAAA